MSHLGSYFRIDMVHEEEYHTYCDFLRMDTSFQVNAILRRVLISVQLLKNIQFQGIHKYQHQRMEYRINCKHIDYELSIQGITMIASCHQSIKHLRIFLNQQSLILKSWMAAFQHSWSISGLLEFLGMRKDCAYHIAFCRFDD